MKTADFMTFLTESLENLDGYDESIKKPWRRARMTIDDSAYKREILIAIYDYVLEIISEIEDASTNPYEKTKKQIRKFNNEMYKQYEKDNTNMK